MKKRIVRENTTKRAGTSVQGTVKNQLEVAEVETLTMSSHMQYELCTDCGMSQDEKKMIELYNHSN